MISTVTHAEISQQPCKSICKPLNLECISTDSKKITFSGFHGNHESWINCIINKCFASALLSSHTFVTGVRLIDYKWKLAT